MKSEKLNIFNVVTYRTKRLGRPKKDPLVTFLTLFDPNDLQDDIRITFRHSSISQKIIRRGSMAGLGAAP